jgi:hypothetical protein
LGFDKFISWDDSIDEHLNGLLKAIMALEQQRGERIKVDVITWRGMMTKVCLLFPSGQSDDLTVCQIMSSPFDRFGR